MKNQIFILILCIFGIFSYNSEKAISYALTYCNKRNPNYGDYSNDFGDSPNFISQCLIAGGENLKGHLTDQYGAIVSTNVLEEYFFKMDGFIDIQLQFQKILRQEEL